MDKKQKAYGSGRYQSRTQDMVMICFVHVMTGRSFFDILAVSVSEVSECAHDCGYELYIISWLNDNVAISIQG